MVSPAISYVIFPKSLGIFDTEGKSNNIRPFLYRRQASGWPHSCPMAEWETYNMGCDSRDDAGSLLHESFVGTDDMNL